MGAQRPVSALLRTLASSLDGNPGPAILRGILAPFPVSWVLVHVVRPDHLALVGHAGIPDSLVAQLRVLPRTGRWPMTEVLTTGIDLVSTRAELTDRFPLAAPLESASHGTVSVSAFRRGGIPVGTTTLGYPHEPPDSADLQQRLDALGDSVALWALSPATVSRAPMPVSTVTDRQREILALVSDGKTNPQIARELSVSVATVKADLSALFRLLGTHTRVDLPGRAIRAGV